jgi:hypothetical protein
MTVLTSKLRTSIRRVVQGRGLTFRQLRWLYRRLHTSDYVVYSVGMTISLWPDYQREQYIRELLL